MTEGSKKKVTEPVEEVPVEEVVEEVLPAEPSDTGNSSGPHVHLEPPKEDPTPEVVKDDPYHVPPGRCMVHVIKGGLMVEGHVLLEGQIVTVPEVTAQHPENASFIQIFSMG